MSAHEEAVNNAGGVPPPGEPLFRVMYHGANQNTGEPTALGTGRLRIETTPTQMIRLQQVLSPGAIHALMLIIEHGFKPGQRIEIHGWGGQWLRDHGMRKYQAEKAAAELRDKGYIRTERAQANSPLGRQVGIVPSGHIEEVEDVPGVPRVPGGPKPRRSRALAPVREHFGPPVSRISGDREAGGGQPVEDPVDSALSRTSREGASRNPGNRDDENVFPQVRAPFPHIESASSTAPTSSSSSEEDLFFLAGSSQALTRHDLARFCAQPELIDMLSSRWEIAVALVARTFAPHGTRCAELVEWLGDGTDAQPATRLAQIVVDLLRTHPNDRPRVAHAQETLLRSRGVKFRQSNPDDFIAVFVTAMVSSLDSTRPIDRWGGWFGGAFKREEHFQGKALAEVADLLNRLLDDPDSVPLEVTPARGSLSAGGTTYEQGDPSYTERLRTAAEGTVWEDEISFEKLLRNPAAQARILAQHAARRPTTG